MTNLTTNPFADVSQAQLERLAFIEFRLYFLGDVRRQDVMERFNIAPAAATRDFALYKEACPNNISFDGSSKTYVLGEAFQAVFPHKTERVLMMLSQGFGDGVTQMDEPLLPCELPVLFSRPTLDILAPVTRAIYQQKAVKLHYCSLTSGYSEREIVPFALANDGLRWHVRAFDRRSGEFRDFVFTRMDSTELLTNSTPAKHERPANDDQWNRMVELELVPHPDRKDQAITERDYGMVNGVLCLKLRAAMVGYVLRQLWVDCSADHHIDDEWCRLWLKDHLALHGVKNAFLSLGYRKPSIGG